ncbi:SMP-30/gluconolactonase/LRE family protein [Conyzicola sp.]|uniref:SMP-30/gluconolactonase/LRE family protein n=1 Tax=Conyzicola sp. TaxID=1969404 RepID=UPI003988E9A6
MNPAPTVFRDARAILGESLVLDDTAPAPALLWCDISAGLLHRSELAGDPGGADDTVWALPAPLASFHRALVTGGPGYVASLGDRVVLVDDGGAIVRELARIDHAHPGLRLNEGKVDPLGNWVTGSMDLTRGAPDGAFYSVTPAGDVRVIAGGLGTSNGLEWSLDGTRVYFTDTAVGTIYTGDYSADGEISDVEVFHRGDMNDGLAIDADGWLWSSIYGDGVVVRYDTQGVERERHGFEVPNLTSVAFAGSTLYVASARENLTEEQLLQHPLSGAVFALETGTTGRAGRVFVTA